MIKLKEELKHISNNKLSKIKKIAKQVRKELEIYYDWNENKSCFKNTCSIVADKLQKKLTENNIYSYRVNGLYYGASDNYEPDLSEWTFEEVSEYNEITDYGKFNDEFGFNHWWVVADNKWIVDITADQFHPDESDKYRVVITNIGDSDYST